LPTVTAGETGRHVGRSRAGTTSTAPAMSSARLDAELVRRGMARSRGHARDLVPGGAVAVEKAVVTKASWAVGPDTAIRVAHATTPAVSRAAAKLSAALDAFGEEGLTVPGKRAVDVGASTGGFTEVLLQRGAASVVAVDVGHGQLVPRLREDPRVVDLEGHNVRDLSAGMIGGPAPVLVADLSFISLRTVLTSLRGLVTDDADLVVLVKPQFEVGRERLGKAGVVRDPTLQHRAVWDVALAATAHSLQPMDVVASPVAGATGNVEYLLWLTARRDPGPPGSWVHRLSATLTSGQPPVVMPEAVSGGRASPARATSELEDDR